jgi:hypothetical protein
VSGQHAEVAVIGAPPARTSRASPSRSTPRSKPARRGHQEEWPQASYPSPVSPPPPLRPPSVSPALPPSISVEYSKQRIMHAWGTNFKAPPEVFFSESCLVASYSWEGPSACRRSKSAQSSSCRPASFRKIIQLRNNLQDLVWFKSCKFSPCLQSVRYKF